MKEELIQFETAKLAKEKGFDISVVNFYTTGKKNYLTNTRNYDDDGYAESNWNNGLGSYPTSPDYVECSAPTQALLQKWLREKCNIEVFVKSEYKNKVKIGFYYGGNLEYSKPIYKTYEEALEEGLQEALKLIKT